MDFISLGKAHDIGASCHYLGSGGSGIIFDAGADPNEDGPASLPDFSPLRSHDVHHAFITHAHHDHIGSIPELNKHWPMAKFHMTPATRTLTTIMLFSSANLQKRKFDEGTSPFRELFDDEDIEEALDRFCSQSYDQCIDLRPGDLRAQFYYSGHLLGSAGILLTTPDEQRIFYTSDTRRGHQTIIPGAEYPYKPVDVLIMESTLGADPEAEAVSRAEEESRFAERVAAVLARGGTVLLPVFMLGRAQEILALLGRFKKQNLIDPETPIYTAGKLREVSRVYDDYRLSTPRMDAHFKVYSVKQREFPYTRKAQHQSLNRPGILVLTSGMMIEKTLSHRVAVEILEDQKHAIFFVGFSRDDLPAGKLLHAARHGTGEILLSPDRGMQPIACEVDRFRFSGHAHRGELTALAEQLKPKTILLVHGATEAKQWLAENLRVRCPAARILTPSQGEFLQI